MGNIPAKTTAKRLRQMLAACGKARKRAGEAQAYAAVPHARGATSLLSSE